MRPVLIFSTSSFLSHFQPHWPRQRTHLRIVILINPRSESARPYRILRPQSKRELERITGTDRIKIQDRLGWRQRELLETTALIPRASLAIRIEIFAEQVESGRNTK